MKSAILVTTSLLLSASTLTQLWAATCKASDPATTHCTLNVKDLRPTQFAVGSIAVDCKAAKISGKSKKKLEKYLEGKDREVPVVVGPDGNFYMTDHHHLATALYRAKSPDWKNKDKDLHVEIIDSYAGKEISWGRFWAEMQNNNRSYNVDNKGMADMSFALLPTDVGGLLNDPYRTLSRWVRESCGYVKLGKPQCDKIRPAPAHEAPFFMEFYWGEFFRKHLPMKVADDKVCQSIPYSPTCLDDEVAQLKGMYEKAMELAKSKEAKDYFESLGLDPWTFGYNPSDEHVQLTWGGDQDACEETPE